MDILLDFSCYAGIMLNAIVLKLYAGITDLYGPSYMQLINYSSCGSV